MRHPVSELIQEMLGLGYKPDEIEIVEQVRGNDRIYYIRLRPFVERKEVEYEVK